MNVNFKMGGTAIIFAYACYRLGKVAGRIEAAQNFVNECCGKKRGWTWAQK